MVDLLERIAAIEKEIRETPYHKGTEHHIGQLKARLAKLKKRSLLSDKKRHGLGFALKKSGDATVVLLGPPSVGKSTLLNRLTRAHARVESWPFTTLSVIPGMLVYKGAKIQIFDLPGIIGGAAKGIGRGREVLSVAKGADLLLLLVDVKTRSRVNLLLKEIVQAGITLFPLVVVNKIDLLNLPQDTSDGKTLREWANALSRSGKSGKIEVIFISAEKGIGLEELKEKIWQQLGLMRVYLKPRWRVVEKKPLILKKGQTVGVVAEKIFPEKKEFKQILLWGKSARFPGQQVSLSHRLEDGDILTFV